MRTGRCTAFNSLHDDVSLNQPSDISLKNKTYYVHHHGGRGGGGGVHNMVYQVINISAGKWMRWSRPAPADNSRWTSKTKCWRIHAVEDEWRDDGAIMARGRARGRRLEDLDAKRESQME